jgi:hypothetical protein
VREPAAGHYRQALALTEALGMLYAMTAQREQACAELSAALDLYRAMEMTFWLPEAEAALVQVAGR